MTRIALLSVPLLVACKSDGFLGDVVAMEKSNDELNPSLTDVRLGLVELPAGSEPVVPSDEEVAGAVHPDAEDYVLPGEEDGDRDAERSTDLRGMADLEDPELLEDHRGDEYTYKARPYGSLIDDNAEEDLEFDDVEQGSIANCYMAAAFSALLYADADHGLRDGMIREIKDSEGRVVTYAVRVYDAWNGPQEVMVDADLPRKGADKPLYGRSTDNAINDEEWAIGLLEKAFAEWRGGYEAIGNGGFSGDVFQGLTGATATSRRITYMNDRTLVETIADAADNNQPMTAGTFGKGEGPFGEDGGADPEGAKIYAWHAYTLMDAAFGEDTAYIKLRNPWASVEPPETYGTDPAFDSELEADDGIFWITIEQFRRLYSSIVIGGAWEPDEIPPADIDDLAITALNKAEGSATLQFTATGDDEHQGLAFAYDVRVSEEPIDAGNFEDAAPVAVADPQSPGTVESVLVEGLDTGLVWYVGLRITDEIGQASDIATVVVDFDGADEPIDEADVAFDFEAGSGDFALDGLWHGAERMLIFAVEGQGSFDTGARVQGTATSPSFVVPEGEVATLSWDQILDVEADLNYDIASLDIVTDEGATTVWSKSEEDASAELRNMSVDITDFIGQQIAVELRFDSVDEANNGTSGWAVDSLTVTVD